MNPEPKMTLLTPKPSEEFYNKCHDEKGLFCEAPGTADRPIKTDDFDRALKALAEGKHVQLSQPRQISTLVDRLRDNVNDAIAKGEEAPNYDLCKVSVKGTNLFCHESKGIPRAKMPQLVEVARPGSKADKLPKDEKNQANVNPQFIQHLRDKGIKVEETTEKASFLRATQKELVGKTVAKTAAHIVNDDFESPQAKIFVSKDNYILDGHHRWAATVAIDSKDNRLGDIRVEVIRADISITELLPEADKFVNDWGLTRSDGK